MTVKPWLLIPIYDHGDSIAGVIDSLEYLQLPCLVVDDGSAAPTRRVLDDIERRCDWVTVEHLPRNRGRGAALRHGYRLAEEQGATHVVQLDADAQHDPRDVGRFLEAAAKNPAAAILGRPIFDASAPWIRVHGRKLSQWCVWLETRSFAIADPLCGFRCLPLAATLRALEGASLGDRMDFDPELVVHLVWNGVEVVNIPARVIYHADGLSHFDLLGDNYRMVRAHAKLLAGVPSQVFSLGARRRRREAGRAR